MALISRPDRRRLLHGLAALPLACATVSHASGFIRQKADTRLIIDNDFAGDPDGLFALAHQMLLPQTDVRAITTTFLNAKFLAANTTQAQTTAEAVRAASDLLALMALPVTPPVVTGAGAPLSSRTAPAGNAAAQTIVTEAMRASDLPMFVTCGGPLTNIATALLMKPEIATRVTVIWIGGGAYPHGGWEYNLATDLLAAQIVFGTRGLTLWQIPQTVYSQCQYSVAELDVAIRQASPLGAWLYDRYTTLPDFVTLRGSVTMGDSPAVLLTAFGPEAGRFTERSLPRIADDMTYTVTSEGAKGRVYDSIDTRLMLADFAARLRLPPPA